MLTCLADIGAIAPPVENRLANRLVLVIAVKCLNHDRFTQNLFS